MRLTWHATGAALLLGILFAAACRGEDPAQVVSKDAAKGAEKEKPKGDAARRLLFEKRCRDGHAGLCGELGMMWEKGYGGPKDKKKADEFYKMACDVGVFNACEAIGVEMTPEQELETLDKNCAAGSAFACNNQGQLLFNGLESVKPDQEKARPLLEKGCEGGYVSSCRTLSTIYALGIGVDKDDAKAAAFKAKGDAAQAAVDALEAEYIGPIPHDELPIGRSSRFTSEMVERGRAQEEARKKAAEEKAQKTAPAKP